MRRLLSVCLLGAVGVLVGCSDGETSSTESGVGGALGGAGGEGLAAGGGVGGVGGMGGGPSDICGDGVVNVSETCDDGNDVAGDGCSAGCTLESGFACPTPGQLCVPQTGTCSDVVSLALHEVGGALRGSYDGDTTASSDQVGAAMCDGRVLGTGADRVHALSLTDVRDVTVRTAFATGDGIFRVLTAPCDASLPAPGEIAFGDGCANETGAADVETLTLLGVPPGTYYVVVDGHAGDEGAYELDVTAVPSTCGNGVLDGIEACDDGNAMPGDGCTQCAIDALFVCTGEPSSCITTCQDGVVDSDTGEQCDDGNAVAGDRCDPTCLLEYTVLDLEPNDTIVDAQLLVDGDVVVGAIDLDSDRDIYRLQLVVDSFVALETYTTIDGNPTNGDNPIAPLDNLVDCPVALGDPDVYLFDSDGDVADVFDALFFDLVDGAGLCAYVGPNADVSYLPAGTYHVRVDAYDHGVVPHYALEVRVQPALGAGDPCDMAFDVCDPSAELRCHANTSTCERLCGNGLIDGLDEECDDGNANDGDRCDNNCVLKADVVEVENNETFMTATPLSAGQVAIGSLDSVFDYDVYSFTVATPAWVFIEQYTTVDGTNANYDGEGNDELDCTGVLLDLLLYDAGGNPADPNTALLYGSIAGDGNCGYLGPNVDGVDLFLMPGTYYIVTQDGHTFPQVVPRYLLDLQVVSPLDGGDSCDPNVDLCHPLQSIFCDPTSTCAPANYDRTNYENFIVDDGFDLAMTTLTFTPAGTTYDAVASVAAGYPDSPGSGTVSSVMPPFFDDDTFEQPFGFPFFGVSYSSVFVNTNGHVTFDGPDSGSFQQYAGAHFERPRISWFFDDLAPQNGGTSVVDVFADRVTVTFDQVPSYDATGIVEVQVQMFASGVITITHLATTERDGLVGLSAGDDLGLPPPATDLSALVLRAAAPGDLVVNEVLADASGVDSNCDGSMDAAQDELVEIVNVSPVPVDLTGVTLADGTQVRHTFGAVTLGAGLSIVVFGGGVSMCPTTAGVVASSGTLDLDDGGDTVTLSTGAGMTFSASTAGLSETRNPDGYGPFVPHDLAALAQGNLSPGLRAPGYSF